MGEHLGNFGARHAVLFGELKVVCQRRVDDAFPDQGGHCHHAAVARAESRVVPHFSKQHVVVQLCKFRGEVPQLHVSGSLCNLFLCHSSLHISHCCGHEQKQNLFHHRNCFWIPCLFCTVTKLAGFSVPWSKYIPDVCAHFTDCLAFCFSCSTCVLNSGVSA